jgi:hypothetical protein
VEISSKHCQSQTERARELKFWENVHPTLCVTCHVSRVTCQMSPVKCHFFFFFFCTLTKIGQSGGATRRRVCYQRGLPRLVYTRYTRFTRYGPLRGPTSSTSGVIRPRYFCPLCKKANYAVAANFWCPVETLGKGSKKKRQIIHILWISVLSTLAEVILSHTIRTIVYVGPQIRFIRTTYSLLGTTCGLGRTTLMTNLY